MSADQEMLSSPSDSESELATPTAQMLSSATLSPPDSQHREHTRTMPTAPSGASFANSNGKRPIQTISNGNDEFETDLPNTTSKSRQDHPTKTHQGSGYSWSRAEDEPGYGWLNKKALDEHQRALEGLVHAHCMVKGTAGV